MLSTIISIAFWSIAGALIARRLSRVDWTV